MGRTRGLASACPVRARDEWRGIVAKYLVGFDGKWQERFDDRDEACEWAREVADTGRVVDVVLKRRLLPPRFVTAFPESERAAREAAWS
jgi:hypothetical protein